MTISCTLAFFPASPESIGGCDSRVAYFRDGRNSHKPITFCAFKTRWSVLLVLPIISHVSVAGNIVFHPVELVLGNLSLGIALLQDV